MIRSTLARGILSMSSHELLSKLDAYCQRAGEPRYARVISSGEALQHFSADVVMTPAATMLHTKTSLLAPTRESSIDLTVFVSCYQEEAYILPTIDTVCAALKEAGGISYEIIVIDDCSRDRSSDLVEDYVRTHPEERILLVRNRVNRGLAQNYIDAAFIGKGQYYRLVCGDNAEPKDTTIAIFRELGKADMLIPYYVIIQGKRPHRQLISRAYTALVNAISGFRLHYYNGLAVHLRYNVMRWHPNTRGFGFQADIICQLLDEGFTYKEIAVSTIERKGEANSHALTFKNMLSVAHTLIELVFRRISKLVYRRK
jgi:glycosyltransferase involved in cell wall biosynthesis